MASAKDMIMMKSPPNIAIRVGAAIPAAGSWLPPGVGDV